MAVTRADKPVEAEAEEGAQGIPDQVGDMKTVAERDAAKPGRPHGFNPRGMVELGEFDDRGNGQGHGCEADGREAGKAGAQQHKNRSGPERIAGRLCQQGGPGVGEVGAHAKAGGDDKGERDDGAKAVHGGSRPEPEWGRKLGCLNIERP